MQHQEFEPPEELVDVIKCFWYDRKDFGELQSSFEVLPDGYAEIIFHFGSVYNISCDGSLHLLASPFLTGLLGQPILFHAKNRLEIIGIRCFPWTVFDLLGLPSGQDEVRVLKHPISQLQPTLNNCIQAGRIDEAIAQTIQYFLDARLGGGAETARYLKQELR